MMKKLGGMRRPARSLIWTGLVGCLLALGGAGTASAQAAHVFNASLSLTGNCSTSSFDPVEDPGCPGGTHPPSGAFSFPTSITTDTYGDIYVASRGSQEGIEGRIDVFSPEGVFITELLVPSGPLGLAVDDEGNLYVTNLDTELLRYSPTGTYEPATGMIAYGGSPTVVAGENSADLAVAVNPVDQHVFVDLGPFVDEYSSAAEGNNFIGSFGSGDLAGTSRGVGLAIDAAKGRIYATGWVQAEQETRIRVFELAPPHALIESIDGSTTPAGHFSNSSAFLSLGVDEGTGNVFAYDGGAEAIYEFGEHGEYFGTISQNLLGHYVVGAQPVVDNGAQSPNGALNPFGRFLFVPAFPSGVGHAFAYGPVEQCPAAVEALSFSGVTETEAQLNGSIEPCFLDTSYTFEYTTKQKFDEQGFAGAVVAGSGQLQAGSAPVPVSVELENLVPGTTYRFRLVATNSAGSDEAQEEFATYPFAPKVSCPNDALRTGASSLLPDCRAYELVTPPSTSAHLPAGLGVVGERTPSREVSATGEQLSFLVEGGGVGDEGTGSINGDPYRASRGADGWSTTSTGPSALEAASILPGGNSPDQGYSFWKMSSLQGSAAIEGKYASYLHYPDGHSALIGRGSLRNDPVAEGTLISENGAHVIFASRTYGGHPAVKLEPQSPAEGTNAVYDRTIEPGGHEETHVVSLLPGNLTPAPGEDASYQGASLDGRGVVFSIGDVLYLRYEDEETFEVGEGVTFAGVAEGGRRVFYLEGGDLFAFEIGRGSPIAFSSSGDVTPVNVAAAGTVAYFVSPSVLVGRANPQGAKPVAGERNLYRSREGTLLFVGTVTKRDVEGEKINETTGGLGLWVQAVGTSEGIPGRFGIDPSRATADGDVLLFESRAGLTGHGAGHTEIYRYDAAGKTLDCVSCMPTLAAVSGEASLMSLKTGIRSSEPLGSSVIMDNLSSDGDRAFFQSTEPLVPSDHDGLQDVYEWEAQGKGSCGQAAGCVYLISSGASERSDYLYAVSPSGNDVFFRTSDVLLPIDREETPSIYDARVGGGFLEAAAQEPCQGEGCRSGLTQPPALGSPGSPAHGAKDNVKPHKRCPKGKRKVRRHGKTRCVKRHHRHHPRTAGQKKKGAGK